MSVCAPGGMEFSSGLTAFKSSMGGAPRVLIGDEWELLSPFFLFTLGIFVLQEIIG